MSKTFQISAICVATTLSVATLFAIFYSMNSALMVRPVAIKRCFPDCPAHATYAQLRKARKLQATRPVIEAEARRMQPAPPHL